MRGFGGLLSRVAKLIGLVGLGGFLVLPPRSLFLFGLGLTIVAAIQVFRRNVKPIVGLGVAGLFFGVVVIARYLPCPSQLVGIVAVVAVTMGLLVLAQRSTGRVGLAVVCLAILAHIGGGYWAYGFANRYALRGGNGDGPVVFLGDSLTAGLGGDEDDLYVTQLQRRFRTRLINAGVAGNMSSDGLARIETDVLVHDPRLVVVMIGGNDMIDGIDREALSANVEAIVRRLVEAQIDVVLVEVPGGAVVDRYLGVYAEIADRHQVRRVGELMLRRVFLMPFRYTTDGIHLSRLGHQVVAWHLGCVLSGVFSID